MLVVSNNQTLTVTFSSNLKGQGVSEITTYKLTGNGTPVQILTIAPMFVSTPSDTNPTPNVSGVQLTINLPTNNANYVLRVSNLRTSGDVPYDDEQSFSAVADLPQLLSATHLGDGEIFLTFSRKMSVLSASIAEYTFTGPTTIVPLFAWAMSDKSVMLRVNGLAAGNYTITGSANLVDEASNHLDAGFNQATFLATPAVSTRSIFTHRGPIAKPEIELQSGVSATLTSPNQVTLTGAAISSSHVGLYVDLSGSALNSGRFKILSRVSATSVKLDSSFTLPDASTISWSLVNPRHGEIADSPSDVTVTINGSPVVPETVIGLLGQVVLPIVPGETDDVKINYAWINNPVVEVRRLNSKEFRLNHWASDSQHPGHKQISKPAKYRYRNVLPTFQNTVSTDIRATVKQPQLRDLKFRAYEREYSVALNDPNLLVLNTPTNKIAYPSMSRALDSTFVNYQGNIIPDVYPTYPWERHGSGAVSVVGVNLLVGDTSADSFPTGQTIFWSRDLDLTFQHVFAAAWSVRILSTATPVGVFTGVAAGFSTSTKAVIVGFLNDSGVSKIGFLKVGYENDPSTVSAWSGGIDSSGAVTGAPATVNTSFHRSYRLFEDRSGSVFLYLDGSVTPTLKIASGELADLSQINAPFEELQGVFFGSVSREAANLSEWAFFRYSVTPTSPKDTATSIFVAYEANVLPEVDADPWTPLGSHGLSTAQSSLLTLDSTSASDFSQTDTGLVGGDFHGYIKLVPLLAQSADTVLDINVQGIHSTHGLEPNALTASIDDGNRLIQLSLIASQASPKISYGGRTFPDQFSPYSWTPFHSAIPPLDVAAATMIGQVLQISDTTNDDGLVFAYNDSFADLDPRRVVGTNDYAFEIRVKLLAGYTADLVGFVGVMAEAYDSTRSVGIQLAKISGVQKVQFHSEGVVKASFDFNWEDNKFHTYKVVRVTGGNLVSLFVDGTFLGSLPYSSFDVTSFSPSGTVSFGSATALSAQAISTSQWAYANFWRITPARHYVGLWKGTSTNSLLDYHLPKINTSIDSRGVIAGNVLTDTEADFSDVTSGDYLLIDSGDNQGVYTIDVPHPGGDNTKLTLLAPLPPNTSTEVSYRIPIQTDWTVAHKYRINKDPVGNVGVYLDTTSTPLMLVDYNNINFPAGFQSFQRSIAGGLPSIAWGAFDPTNISQSKWDYVRYGAIRSSTEQGIVPHHMVLNQRNIIASYEHHMTAIPHTHTDFWSESEGIPPQTVPDLLSNPNVVAYTLLNDSTPLVPSTQTYEVRGITPTITPIGGLGNPSNVLGNTGFLLNTADSVVTINVPEDVLYNQLKVIETATGVIGIIAPFDDNTGPLFDEITFTDVTCLTYDGNVLPENVPLSASSPTPWVKDSENDSHQTASTSAGVLTFSTDSVGTKTIYRNSTPLTDYVSLFTEVKFRLKLLQDSSSGLGDSQVRFGFSTPGATVALGFVTSPLGERYVLAYDINQSPPRVVGGLPFDFLDGNFHDYTLSRDPATNAIQIKID